MCHCVCAVCVHVRVCVHVHVRMYMRACVHVMNMYKYSCVYLHTWYICINSVNQVYVDVSHFIIRHFNTNVRTYIRTYVF